MNILLTCSNGMFTGEALNLLSKIDYIDKVYLADAKEAKYISNDNFILPLGTDENYLTNLIEICIKNNIKFVLPRSDEEILSVSKNVSKLRKHFISSYSHDLEIVSLLYDKAEFFKKLKSNGLDIDFYVPRDWKEIYDFRDIFCSFDSKFLIIKPRRSSGSKGVWLIDILKEDSQVTEIVKNRTFLGSLHSCFNYMNENSINSEDYLMQPYYGSDVYDVDNLYVKSIDKLFQVCRKRIYKNEFSPINQGCIITQRKDIELYVCQICRILGIDGFLDLDIVLDINNKPRVIDASARLSGSISASHNCNVNFLKIILDYYIKGLIPEEIYIKDTHVIPYEGFKIKD